MSTPSRNASDPSASDGATLFELLPVGAYRSSTQGAFLRANAALVRFNGYNTEAELLARCRDVAREWYVDARQRERFRERLERDGRVIGMVSEVYRHYTRERVWVSENAHIVRDGQGQVLYYEGTVEEITDRVRAEAALQRSEAHLRLITQHLPGMIYRVRVSPHGHRVFTFVSDGVRGLYGVEPAAVLADGNLLERFRHPDDDARVAETIRRNIGGGGPTSLEFRICLADGTQKWVQWLSRAVAVPEPDQVRIGVVIDITAQRQAAELRLQRDRAEAADRAKTELLSRVSHELRTPLNAVLGFGQLLESDPALSERHRLWTRQIVASGEHLLGLVDDVLDVSAAQAGRLNLSCSAVELRAALHEAWAMLAVAGPPVSLRLDDAGHAPPLWVQADARRLKQVLNNLLSNAIKYNRPGGEVRVAMQRVAAEAGDGAAVELRIADTGLGLNAEQLERLFQPFERAGAQHTAVPGTGLGLALSQQLAEAMGGHITASSEPGVGSTFTLRLRASAPPMN